MQNKITRDRERASSGGEGLSEDATLGQALSEERLSPTGSGEGQVGGRHDQDKGLEMNEHELGVSEVQKEVAVL
jgi:hypothetical protein